MVGVRVIELELEGKEGGGVVECVDEDGDGLGVERCGGEE